LGILEIRSHELFAQGWLRTLVFLISTSWDYRHEPLAPRGFLVFWSTSILLSIVVY
jgi:hypothetical protein